MARTTTEHELVIDVLDDVITFAYAFEEQLAVSDDLQRLTGLVNEVYNAITRDRGAFPWIDKPGVLGVVARVLNGLQAAACSGLLPEYPAFGVEWLNKPSALDGLFLHRANVENACEIGEFIRNILGRLERDFIHEVKPYVTRQQVSAVVRLVAKEMTRTFAVPIHTDTLADIVHQFFLKRLGAPASQQGDAAKLRSLTDLYAKRARVVLVGMVEAAFVARTVKQLYPRVRSLNIEIDRYYTWGALGIGPMEPTEVLRLYSDLNISNVMSDAKFDSNASLTGNNLSPEQIIGWGAGYCPRAMSPKRLDSPQIYFDTDDTEILIDGRRIQKHLHMAIRYDQAVADIDSQARRYAQYLNRRAGRHSAPTPTTPAH